MRVGGAVESFQRADDEKKAHHGQGAKQQGGAATPVVEKEHGGKGEGYVQDVLDGGGEQRIANAGGLHYIDYVIHHAGVLLEQCGVQRKHKLEPTHSCL